jgi:hypothetical protein
MMKGRANLLGAKMYVILIPDASGRFCNVILHDF